MTTVSIHAPMDDAPMVSSRLVKAHIQAAMVSLFFSLLAGTLYALQFMNHYPFPATEWLSPGRVRLIHTNMIAYGFLTNSFFAILYYVLPRATGHRVLSEKLGTLVFWAWQFILLSAGVGFLLGKGQAVEWGETPTGFKPGRFEPNWIPVDLLVVIGVVFALVQFFTPIVKARGQKLYVTLWYFTAGLVWLPLTYLMGTITPEWVLPGASGAAVTGLFIHDLVGLWVTPLGWGTMYFFVPIILRKPIWSHALSVMGFWALAFFYPLGGVHHFLLSPIPDYVEIGAISTTVAIEVVVTTVVVNFMVTMKGSWDALRTQLPIRWFLTGMLLYLTTCIQCAFQTTWSFQRIIHFTDWVVGHAHLVMFGVFSFWIYGVMTWLWPRLCGREWAKPALNTWHYWLTTVGLVTMFFTLVAAGLVAGQLQANLSPWNDILAASKPYWILRLVAGLMMFAGFLCFAANMWLTARTTTAPAYDERRHLMPEPVRVPAEV